MRRRNIFQKIVDYHRRYGTLALARRAGNEIGFDAVGLAQDLFVRFMASFLKVDTKAQNEFFFDLAGTTRDAAEKLHSQVSRDVNLMIRPNDSPHRLAFAAFASGGFRPRSILEIGTQFGWTTAYLAKLFPDADITTVNLPADDPIFRFWHPSGEPEEDPEVKERLSHLNITALRTNSLWLSDHNLPGTFDFIWLDGGHFFPEVAWDHYLSVQKLAPGGWLFSDDIVMPDQKRWWNRVNPDPFTVINYFNERMPGMFSFLLKREDKSSYVQVRKYIAFHNAPLPLCRG